MTDHEYAMLCDEVMIDRLRELNSTEAHTERVSVFHSPDIRPTGREEG